MPEDPGTLVDSGVLSRRLHPGPGVVRCIAGFLAGKAYREYRRRGGARTSPLPDFFIGAHAAVSALTLLTRDAGRFRTYFPTVRLITP